MNVSVKKLFIANCVIILFLVFTGIFMVNQLSYAICRQRFLRQPTSSDVQLLEVGRSRESQTNTGIAVQQDERTKYDKLEDRWNVIPRQKYKADQKSSGKNTSQNDIEQPHGKSSVDDKQTEKRFLVRQNYKLESVSGKEKKEESNYNVALSNGSRDSTTEITPRTTKWSTTIPQIPSVYRGAERPTITSKRSRNEVTEAREISVMGKPVSGPRRISTIANEESKALSPTGSGIRKTSFPIRKVDPTRKPTTLVKTTTRKKLTESAVAVKTRRNVLLKSSVRLTAAPRIRFATTFTTHEKKAANGKPVPTTASLFTRKQQNVSPTIVGRIGLKAQSVEKRVKIQTREISIQRKPTKKRLLIAGGETKLTNATSGKKRMNTTYRQLTTPSPKTEIPIIDRFLSKKERLHEFYLTDPLKEKSAGCDKGNVLLTIIVASGPKRWERRTSIRRTWASTNYSRVWPKLNSTDLSQLGRKDLVRVVFLLGKSDNSVLQRTVEKEARWYRDIVFGEFYDTYRNLTRKTRMGLRWARNYCTSAKYVLKTDDDVLVNVYKLVEWLDTRPRNKFYTGWCNTGSRAVRRKRSKWYVSREDYSPDIYPTYCLGGGYLMSKDVLHGVVELQYERRLVPMEDLDVGLLVRILGVKPVDNKKRFDMTFKKPRRLCRLNEILLAHRVNQSSMALIQTMAEKARTEC